MSNNPIFIIYESRYNYLSAFIKYKKLKSMKSTNKKLSSILEWQIKHFYEIYSSNLFLGEIVWFYSFILFLEDNNYPYIHSENYNDFLKSYEEKKNKPHYLIVDQETCPQIIQQVSISRLYCMSFWQIFDIPDIPKIIGNNYIDSLGYDTNNQLLPLRQVLTPHPYSEINHNLGFNLTILPSINKTKYRPIGLLWGKSLEYINIPLIQYLCSKGIEFYSTTNNPINIKGVIHLGYLSTELWCQLVHDVKFILGFGNPISGPTILEALYYKTPIIAPGVQFNPYIDNNLYPIEKIIDRDIVTNFNQKSSEILACLTENDYAKIIDQISTIEFKENKTSKELCCPKEFEKRFNTIFNS